MSKKGDDENRIYKIAKQNDNNNNNIKTKKHKNHNIN
jgi:hypothetical protein